MKSTPPMINISIILTMISLLIPPSLTTRLPPQALPTRSGYINIKTTTGSSMFYTFYEAQNITTTLSTTPLLIWLQGGPGCSSMTGNFYELGPYRVNNDLSLEPNPGSWNRLFGLLFVDNPIGTGFSIASSVEEIPKNQHEVGEHLYVFIKKFIGLDASFKTRPIYITGESYAGKYVPAIGWSILMKERFLPVEKRVNLQGLAIGNGLTEPVFQVSTHALHAYNLGLINIRQRFELEKLQNEAMDLVSSQNWTAATDARNKVLNYLQTATGLATLYDFRRMRPYDSEWVVEFLKDPEVKKALGVNESMVYEECSDVVGAVLHADVMKSVRYMVQFLVTKTKVLLYQGQCDLRDGVVSVESWVMKMNWEGIERFLNAERNIWKVNDVLAGYVQKSDNLSNVVVLGAGHFVPTDQNVHSQAMIEDWVLDRGLFGDKKHAQNLSVDH